MKYINIDAEFMIKHKLTIEQSAFLSYLRESLTWAQDVLVDDKVYKWVSRGKVVSDIPYITSKPDTVYRWFTRLKDLGLIEYIKKDNKDLYKMLPVCNEWNSRKNSDLNPDNSDGDPSKLGLGSELGSDGNPTYSNINTNSKIYDSKEKTKMFVIPDLSAVELYAKQNGFDSAFAKVFFDYYSRCEWTDAENKKVKNWKNKMQSWISREQNDKYRLDAKTGSVKKGSPGVFYDPTAGVYWKVWSKDGQRYECWQHGEFKTDDNINKIPYTG
jgi:hypothetical protein